jgi:class 3 adenylate cyclase/tetratricopeptide (TPR) repeat protein
MDCPHCRRENPADARFCNGCGAALPLTCGSCGRQNPPDSRFCSACSAPLAAPAAAESALPSIAAGERRQATILFSDLSGYTAMGERLDPEEVEAIMGRIKAEAVRIVEGHGGTVNQFVGDEVLALFGVPAAHEDDPLRAVRAARELHALVRALSPGLEARTGAPLRMHSGINTGLVVIRSSDQRDGNFGVTGDTVNTAARLVAQAAADQILLSPETQRLVAPYFETAQQPDVALKGKAAPVTPYAVTAESAVRTRLEAAMGRGLSRYVGRERELAVLRECLQSALEGRGQAVTVVGVAGLGKSRLFYEFSRSLDSNQINLAVGRCTATGAEYAFHPIQDLLKRWFGITDADSRGSMEAKTEAALNAMHPALGEHLPALLHLLSIGGERALPPTLAGEVVLRRVLAALKACLAASSAVRPLVMILEDLHWMDPSSELVVRQIVEVLPAQRALLLLNFRPEYQPDWAHRSNVTPLALRPLGGQDTGEIIASTLKVEQVPPELAALVHARTDGNPFFAEEVTLCLLEEGAIARDDGHVRLTRPLTEIRFPDSVQAIVRTRIDHLAETERETLRLAAVVGREFTENVVARLSELKERAAANLERLKSLEMILETRFHPELAFMFKHAITHQVAYGSLLLQRRKALHRLVGLAIEELYAERLPEFYEMLAHHFEQGEVWDKALAYLVHAGNKARRNFALNAALAFFERGRQILERHEPTVPWTQRHDLFMGHAQSQVEMGNWPQAEQVYRVAADLARRENDIERRVPALMAWANATRYGVNVERILPELDAVEPLVVDHPTLRLAVALTRCQALTHVADVSQVLAAERRVAGLLSDAPPSFYRTLSTWWLALVHRWQGEAAGYVDTIGPMVPHLKEGAPPSLYLGALFLQGVALGEVGRYQEAVDLLSEGRAFGLEIGERVQTPKAMNSLGWALHELGQHERAIALNDEALGAIRREDRTGDTSHHEVWANTMLNLGENHLALGHLKQADTRLRSVLDVADRNEYHWARPRWKTRCRLALGELAMAGGDSAAAQAHLDEARADQWLDGYPMKKYQVRAARLQGAIHAALDRPRKARQSLHDALERAQALGFPTPLWHAQLDLGDFLARKDKAREARAAYGTAADTVQGIADGLTDEALRRDFLAAAPVARLIVSVTKR